MFRSLTYYWRSHLAVLLGAAVACAVLTGALLVGDSVRGSLRDLALDRLGQVDYALVSQRLFRSGLAGDLASDPRFQARFGAAAPALLLNGTAINATTRARASQVNIYGIDRRFVAYFEQDFDLEAGPEAAVAVSQSLARQLDLKEGDPLLLSFQRLSDVHPETLLGNRDTEKVVERIRARVTRVLPDEGLGRFGISPNQNLPLNAFISLTALQAELGQAGRSNAIFFSRTGSSSVDAGSVPGLGTQEAEADAGRLSALLADRLLLDDYGLFVRDLGDIVSLESRQFVLETRIGEAVLKVAEQTGLETQPILTYLANTIRVGARIVPYSTVTAVDAGATFGRSAPSPFGRWIDSRGREAASLVDGQIYLNEWAARELRPLPDDTVEVTYYRVGPGEELETEAAEFRYAGTVRLRELGADRNLTADYPGIGDADNMADWDPPFPVELGLIREQDERYWDDHRATPKAFVNLQTGQKHWTSRFGNLTAIRIAKHPLQETPVRSSEGGPSAAAPRAGTTLDAFSKALLEALPPQEFGFSIRSVKHRALQASSGATEFTGLFLAFSFFLILSSALLVALLFRLGVEQRVKEIGTLLSLGFPVRKVSRRLLLEGGSIALLGCTLGIGGAWGYAWLMLAGLRTLWLPAVGTPFLQLHVLSQSLAIGLAASLIVVMASVWLAVRQIARLPAPALLAGVTRIYRHRGPSKAAKVCAWGGLGLAAPILIVAFFLESTLAAGAFFGLGFLVLISGMGFFSLWSRSTRPGKVIGAEGSHTSLFTLAARNTARSPGRSLLCASLVAVACFVIVAVGALHHDFGDEVLSKQSGAGGFALLAQTDVPILRDLNDDESRYDLGFSDTEIEKLSQTRFLGFRYLPGDDASCLNLYQPEKPRILGVPPQQIERGGFTFSAVSAPRINPWALLEDDLGENVIPAFADANSAQWILKVPLGGEIVTRNEMGRELRLRLVGLLQTSVFQSEVLISESNFIRHYPSRSGYSYFLAEIGSLPVSEAAFILEKTLEPYGFDTISTVEKLADYHAVQNTYLSTFQILGGLGMLLGTLGLGIILTRNVLERRGELATMRAFGFPRKRLANMVLAENAFLLSLGMLIGTAAALLAVLPRLLLQAGSIPWLSLIVTLAAIFVLGLASSSTALRKTLGTPLLPALKEEN